MKGRSHTVEKRKAIHPQKLSPCTRKGGYGCDADGVTNAAHQRHRPEINTNAHKRRNKQIRKLMLEPADIRLVRGVRSPKISSCDRKGVTARQAAESEAVTRICNLARPRRDHMYRRCGSTTPSQAVAHHALPRYRICHGMCHGGMCRTEKATKAWQRQAIARQTRNTTMASYIESN